MSASVIEPPAASPTLDTSQHTVAIDGEHDVSTIEGVSLLLADAIGRGADPLVVDLSDVTFMDASVVGLLIRSRSFLDEDGRTLIVQSPSRQARRVLELCSGINPTGLATRDDAAPVVSR